MGVHSSKPPATRAWAGVRRMRALLALATVVALWCGRGVLATSVIAPTFEQLVDQSREIFVGTVVARSARWVDSAEGASIVTLVTFRIDESLKGGLLTQTSLEFLGGTVGDTTLEVSGLPAFAIGDRDVIFVGHRNAVSPLMAFAYGRVRILKDAMSGADTVRMYDGSPFSSTSAMTKSVEVRHAVAQDMSLAVFRTQIVARLRANGGR